MPQPPEVKSSPSRSSLNQPKERAILVSIISLLIICFLMISCGSCSSTPQEDIQEVDKSDILGEGNEEKPKYKVLEIVDGDTIKIDYNGQEEKVRLIGIDTPETNECFNTEATNKLKSLLGNNEVEIEADQTQGERDKYNRLLLYIWLNGELINKTMISEGYAHEYTYNLPYKYQTEFKDSQAKAQNTKRGLWGDECSCEKDREKNRVCIGYHLAEVAYYNWDCSTYKKQVKDTNCSEGCTVNTPPRSTTTTTLPIAPKYICDCSKTCPQMSSCEEAYFQLNNCGCSKRDGNNNGIPCETICPGG